MTDRALFAGGCFWCMVAPFDELPGVEGIHSGYTGGHTKNPTYEEVLSHTTGHTEAVEILFNPEILSYEELVTLYWQQTDPTDAMGQFQDRGDNYRPVIFVLNEEQRNIAEISKQQLENSGKYKKKIVTTIEEAGPFYLAEEEHQDFYRKNPERYTQEKIERKEYVDNKKRVDVE